jgi:ubiquitin C-terminal hydrolase
MRPSATDLCWHVVKDGKHQDAEEFLRLYLDALDEELVELHKILNVKELEEEAQSAEGQTGVGEQNYTVRL